MVVRKAPALAACGLLLGGVLLAAGPARAQNAAPGRATEEYRIGPGDVLQFFVWKEPDLTSELTVRIDGKVTVPLLGEVQAAGQTPSELAAGVTSRLGQFLAAPQVTVNLARSFGARFFVLGRVMRSGEFPLQGRTTLVQALAMAGGFQEFANTDEIVIVRQARSGEVFLKANYKRLESGKDASQNYEIRSADTILVP